MRGLLMQRGRNQVKSEVKEQGWGLMVQIVLRIKGEMDREGWKPWDIIDPQTVGEKKMTPTA